MSKKMLPEIGFVCGLAPSTIVMKIYKCFFNKGQFKTNGLQKGIVFLELYFAGFKMQ